MSRKHFSWLLLVTLAAAVLVLVIPGKTGKESGIGQGVFIPALADQVNDIEWLRLTGAGGVTIATLSRKGGAWVVEEAKGYRADWSLVKKLLSSLSLAEVIEAKTSNPGYYDRLGVEDVSGAGAAGILLEFTEASGLPAVIIGNRAQGRDGQYLRLAGAEQSVLTDFQVDLPRERSGWLDRAILDISDAEVVEYRIMHSGEEPVTALKASADDENFVLQNVPENREIKSAWSVNAPANSLAALDLQNVAPAGEFDWDGATRFWVLTADGLTVEAELTRKENGDEEDTPAEAWLRLTAGVYTTAVDMALPDEQTATARAAEINGRVGGWAFQVPDYRLDTMAQAMEDFLQAPGSE